MIPFTSFVRSFFLPKMSKTKINVSAIITRELNAQKNSLGQFFFSGLNLFPRSLHCSQIMLDPAARGNGYQSKSLGIERVEHKI